VRPDERGIIFVGARVNSRFSLRACILNFRTTEADVEALWTIAEKIAYC
jgi:hypothetical protein